MRLRDHIAARLPYRLKDALRPPAPPSARPAMRQSFAQCGEDLILRFVFEQLGVERPTYLDIGAFHPWELSNTALLYLSGSRGINVEPDPAAIGLFAQERPEDVNVNAGVGPERGKLTLHRFDAPALNTFSQDSAQIAAENGHALVGTVEVDVLTVPDILGDKPCPDLLSLDAEGMDLEILRTIPQWPTKPRVICVETVGYSRRATFDAKTTEARDLLAEMGYACIADTYINSLFLGRTG